MAPRKGHLVKTMTVAEVHADGTTSQMAPQRATYSYFSRMCEYTAFAKDVQVEINRRQVKQSDKACAVNDGGEWIPPVIEICRCDAVRILDFEHGAEHLAEPAREVFGENTPEFHAWFDTTRHGPAPRTGRAASEGHFQLRHEAPDVALNTLAELGQAHPNHIETINKTQAYFIKRLDMINYVEFKNAQWPIGSGAGEAAHKIVIQARMKGAGMRWGVDNINPMAALRNLICKSGRSRGHDRWNADWPLIVNAQMEHESPPPPPPKPASLLPPSAPSRGHGFKLRPATAWRDQPIGSA